MSQPAETSLIARLTRPFQVAWLTIRRFLFHLTLRYRTAPPQLQVSRPDEDAEDPHPEELSPSSRTHAVLTMSSSENADLNTERSMHADHSESVVDETPSVGTETDSAVAEKATYRLLEQPKLAFRTRSRPAAETAADDVAESEAEDDEAGWVTAFFGPASPRRNLWLFVGSTGTIGLILAIILLFNGKAPEDARIATKSDADSKPTVETAETTEPEKETTPEPEAPPFVPEAPPFAEKEPEPEPEPEPVVVVTPEPEPEPPPVEDDIGVEVILLPSPGQGEQFEVSGSDEPLDPNVGFTDLVKTGWQKTNLLSNPPADAWSELQKLVPLEPYGPQESVEPPAVNERSVAATFKTTQPQRAGQSLLMPYELTVTNTGTATLDRIVLEQSLPESVKLHDTAAVHAAQERTLRWEHERLRPQEIWNIPIVTVPTQEGQITLPTTLSVGSSVSAQTLVQTPDVKLVMTCRPAAKYKKYHQIVFQITNTGEVPLNKLLMNVHLTGNLWHRFGQNFEFFEEQLDVGKTREALLHVKTQELGGAQLQASLTTNEGAEASAGCQFTVVKSGAIESREIPERPAANTTREEASPQNKPKWRTRPDSEPRIVPDASDPFSLPAAPKPTAKPVSQPKPVEPTIETPPMRSPISPDSKPPVKPESNPADPFPEFPGGLDPLPERKPVVPPRQPLETESTKETPFDPPPEKKEDKEAPAEKPSEPLEEDPFAPKKEPDFFGDE